MYHYLLMKIIFKIKLIYCLGKDLNIQMKKNGDVENGMGNEKISVHFFKQMRPKVGDDVKRRRLSS